ncbi:IS200/IS605 family transposase [Candidatus Micrarchaeota archaeon]|nr:IS200/IS605 family transposase [Candidatus Micrarchaeota archaeon]
MKLNNLFFLFCKLVSPLVARGARAPAKRRRYAMISEINRHLYGHNHIKGCWEYHVEWCSKYRYNVLRKESIRLDCEQAIKEAAGLKNWELLELAVMSDHVHAVVRTQQPVSVSDILFYLKGRSSYDVFKKHPNLRLRYPKGHLWSPGKFCRTVGADLEVARKYVRNQIDIHQKKLGEWAS